MKGYFRQKKKTSITNYKSKSSQASKKKSTKSAAVPQDDYDANEKLLRQFDMNMAYGPCTGLSRLERCQRAEAWGLKPPKEIENLLKSGEASPNFLWNARL